MDRRGRWCAAGMLSGLMLLGACRPNMDLGMIEIEGEGDVATFMLDATEVTVAAYRLCVNAGKCQVPRTPTAPDMPGWSHPTWGLASPDEFPVNCVDLDRARAYCAWRGSRLPTEAEWLFAAQGTKEVPYPWGAQPDLPQDGAMVCWNPSAANFPRKMYGPCPVRFSSAGTASVSTIKGHRADPADAGLYDMLGNVEELTDAGITYGWGWNMEMKQASYKRQGTPPDADATGFRCARSP